MHLSPSGGLLRRPSALGSCRSLHRARRRQREVAFGCGRRVVAAASSAKQKKYDSVIPSLDALRTGQLLNEWRLDVNQPKELKEKWLYVGLTMATNGSLKRVCSSAHAVLGTSEHRDHLEVDALLLLPSMSGPGNGKRYGHYDVFIGPDGVKQYKFHSPPEHVPATVDAEYAFMQAGWELARHHFIGGVMNNMDIKGAGTRVGTSRGACDWGSSAVYIVAGTRREFKHFAGNKWDIVDLQVMRKDTTRRAVPCAAATVLNHCSAEEVCRFADDGECDSWPLRAARSKPSGYAWWADDASSRHWYMHR